MDFFLLTLGGHMTSYATTKNKIKIYPLSISASKNICCGSGYPGAKLDVVHDLCFCVGFLTTTAYP